MNLFQPEEAHTRPRPPIPSWSRPGSSAARRFRTRSFELRLSLGRFLCLCKQNREK